MLFRSGIAIDPKFNRKHDKVDEDRLQVVLGVQIDCELFRLHVEINGLFHCQKWETDPQAKEMILTNTSAILFPYLRSIVSNTTMSANIPSYTIPVMNIVELFKGQ